MNENAAISNKYLTNVPMMERVTSIAAGSLLIINALANKNKFTSALVAAGGYLIFRGATGHCDVYEAAGKGALPDPIKNINIKVTLFVNKPRTEVYAFWRKLSNLPLFMRHLHSVTPIDGKRSLWKAKIPGGLGDISWEADIVKDEPGKLIGWNSLPGAAIDNAGKVEFRDAGDNATELRAVITYRAPLGAVGAGFAKLLNPVFEKMIIEDVKDFKRYIETGAVPEELVSSLN